MFIVVFGSAFFFYRGAFKHRSLLNDFIIYVLPIVYSVELGGMGLLERLESLVVMVTLSVVAL